MGLGGNSIRAHASVPVSSAGLLAAPPTGVSTVSTWLITTVRYLTRNRNLPSRFLTVLLLNKIDAGRSPSTVRRNHSGAAEALSAI